MLLISIVVISILLTASLVYFQIYPLNLNLLWKIPLTLVGSYFCLLILIVGTIILLTYIIRPVDKKSRFSRFLRRMNVEVAQIVNFFFGIRIKKYNMDLIPKDRKFLVVSNHQSNFDPLILINVLKEPNLILIMKDNILKVPILNRWLVSAGFLPLDRENNREALKTVLEACNWVSDGYTLGVYPEGTRSKTGQLLPLRTGIFKVALKSQCPIVVCACDGMYKVKKNFPILPTKIFFKVSKVLTYEEIKDLSTNEIGEIVSNIMKQDLKEARSKYSYLKNKKTRV